MTDIYTVAQTVRSSGSGRGNSYWEIGANCGFRRFLEDQLGRDPDAPQPDWAIRGTYMHLLLQWWQEGKLAKGQIIEHDESDMLWREAVTLFDWFASTYPRDFWGRVIGTEVQFPSTDEEKRRVAEFFDVPLEYAPTMRSDVVTEIDAAGVERFAQQGVLLPGPGVYIVDWKHGGAHGFDDGWKFTEGTQPLMYLTLSRKFWKDPPRGIIYHKVSMTKEKSQLKLKPTSFRIYVATWQPNFEHECRSMVQFAYQSLLRRDKNRYACNGCPFFRKECQGF